jgi:hypothetical protein
MKKQLLSILLVFTAGWAIAQNSNCSKIKQLVAEANKKQMQTEAVGEKFQTADDFDAWMANTKLDGASKCYIQDAHVSKMYVAEFGTSSESKTADPSLSKKMDELSNMFKGCLGAGFMYRAIGSSENIFKGIQYDGKGENINTKITLMLIYNPSDKKQLLFVSIVNDPD